jgi:hypothetical protein
VARGTNAEQEFRAALHLICFLITEQSSVSLANGTLFRFSPSNDSHCTNGTLFRCFHKKCFFIDDVRPLWGAETNQPSCLLQIFCRSAARERIVFLFATDMLPLWGKEIMRNRSSALHCTYPLYNDGTEFRQPVNGTLFR